MFINLFKWLQIALPVPVWVLTFAAILLWWFITWGLAKILLNLRVRSGRVIYNTQMVLFLVGAILIFNLTLVPIVLVALNGMAFYALGLCGFFAVVYLIKVNERQTATFGASSSGQAAYLKNDDPFK